ncbi:sulfur oxidation c-type cytochrome SoxX [Sulfurovum sp. ST-21]|uniref:Sulfur oxidation c-type cytochrome SoxX n=1 Tax=Sulfurovum indicum TaxID=2779528 RepID=A0A7M1S221_9BACT|nr:sulfur oxidation c-type cytochrome SoxX [Sulfurovum indicum]QOR61493.1 sulfur oxidation c-type cytochrome SoxX [Sulfurovum indicum]
MQKRIKLVTIAAMLISSTSLVSAVDLTKAYEMPDASKLIEKDKLAEPTKYTMPEGCVTTDAEAIARGEYIFHNLNGKKAKKKPPKGLVKFIEQKGKDGKVKKKPKQYGNCVACHNIEGAVGGGNIGPDLTGYKAMFIDTKIRDHQFVFQKIADPRIDNPNTHMTVNLTTKLFNEREICDLTSYVVAEKKKK